MDGCTFQHLGSRVRRIRTSRSSAATRLVRGQLGLRETHRKETGEEWIRGGNRRGVGKIDWEERMEGKLRPGCKKRRKE